MSVIDLVRSDVSIRLDEDQCRDAGRKLAQQYQSAAPFPHIAIEEAFPADLLAHVAKHYPDTPPSRSFDQKQERLKRQFHPEQVGDDLSRNLIYALNTQPFLGFLSEMTGIEGLVADPYFAGGGLHETLTGGHLGIHADFNRHNIMNVRRRLNLLIYLNEDWEDQFGGFLELWSRDMKKCEKRVKPAIGTAVVFNTDLDSFHGHPDPLQCPEDKSRRSIALYYYTSAADLNDQPDRTTNFKARPNSNDRSNVKTTIRHFINDWTPPAIKRWRNKK